MHVHVLGVEASPGLGGCLGLALSGDALGSFLSARQSRAQSECCARGSFVVKFFSVLVPVRGGLSLPRRPCLV